MGTAFTLKKHCNLHDATYLKTLFDGSNRSFAKDLLVALECKLTDSRTEPTTYKLLGELSANLHSTSSLYSNNSAIIHVSCNWLCASSRSLYTIVMRTSHGVGPKAKD